MTTVVQNRHWVHRLDRRLVRGWIGVWFMMKSASSSLTRSAFGSLADQRLDRSFSSSLSLLFAEFFLSLALSLFSAWKETV